jgi:hypothetical protein
MRFIIGLLFFGIGFMMVWKRQWFVHNFSQSQFFTQWFGSMYGFYTIVGMLIMFGSVMYVVGAFDRLVERIFGPLVGG